MPLHRHFKSLVMLLPCLAGACTTMDRTEPSQDQLTAALRPFMECTHRQAIVLDDHSSPPESIAKAALYACDEPHRAMTQQVYQMTTNQPFIDGFLGAADRDAFKYAVIDVLKHRQSS